MNFAPLIFYFCGKRRSSAKLIAFQYVLWGYQLQVKSRQHMLAAFGLDFVFASLFQLGLATVFNVFGDGLNIAGTGERPLGHHGADQFID